MNHEKMLEQHGLKLGMNPDWITNQVYHGGPGVSNSNLKTIRIKSPAHLKAEKETPKVSTPAMDIGQAFHTMTLEPQHFERRFSVVPFVDGEMLKKKNGSQVILLDEKEGGVVLTKKTDAGKEWYSKNQQGKIIITPSDLIDVNCMVESIRSHPEAAALLTGMEGTVYERPIYYIDKKTGMLCKVKPDININNSKIRALADLKKCEDASESGFRRACGNYYYDMQAGMYLDGASSELPDGDQYDEFVYICCEPVAPYAVAVYRATPEMIEIGRDNYRPALEQYKTCMESGEWPGYPTGINPIDLPMWRL